MNTLISRTVTLASFAGFSAVAAAQGSPVIYPSFLPTANQVTATGQMNYDVQVPNNQASCVQAISDSLAITSSTMLDVSASTNCAVAASSPITTGGEGCSYSGLAEVQPQAAGSGSGFAYDVVGDTDSLQIVARSNHFLQAEVHKVGLGPGATSGTSTADFSIDDPAVISVPFAIVDNGSMVVVYAGDSVFSRQAGALSGSGSMSWRIVADQNRNGLIDINENFTVLAGGQGPVGNGISSNSTLASNTINRGLYVLELTFETRSGAEAEAFCSDEDGPGADSQSGVESVATRLNVSFL